MMQTLVVSTALKIHYNLLVCHFLFDLDLTFQFGLHRFTLLCLSIEREIATVSFSARIVLCCHVRQSEIVDESLVTENFLFRNCVVPVLQDWSLKDYYQAKITRFYIFCGKNNILSRPLLKFCICSPVALVWRYYFNSYHIDSALYHTGCLVMLPCNEVFKVGHHES